MNAQTCLQYCLSPLNLTAARSACWQIACLMCSYSVTLSPNEREHTICCFAGGASSRLIQLSPFSSRTVLSSNTLKCLRIMAGFARESSSAVVMPIPFSFLAMRLPTPQTSSTGWRASIFSARTCDVMASTPPN